MLNFLKKAVILVLGVGGAILTFVGLVVLFSIYTYYFSFGFSLVLIIVTCFLLVALLEYCIKD